MHTLELTTTLLVLVSAAIHAVWNAIVKRTRAPEDAIVGAMVISAIAASGIALVFRPPWPPNASLGWCLASGALEAVYFSTLARALTRAPLGPVYTTVRGGALVVVWPVSVLFLGERVSLGTAFGTALVVLGLVATGLGDRSPGREMRLGWAIVCAVFVGAYQIAYKLGLATGGAPTAMNAISLGSASLVNLVAGGWARAGRGWSATRREPLKVVTAGMLAAAGFVLFLIAMKDAGAGVAVTLRNTSILFAQAIAFAMGEKPTRLGLVGAALVTGGAVLLSVPR